MPFFASLRFFKNLVFHIQYTVLKLHIELDDSNSMEIAHENTPRHFDPKAKLPQARFAAVGLVIFCGTAGLVPLALLAAACVYSFIQGDFGAHAIIELTSFVIWGVLASRAIRVFKQRRRKTTTVCFFIISALVLTTAIWWGRANFVEEIYIGWQDPDLEKPWSIIGFFSSIGSWLYALAIATLPHK
ncbi:hypothetical protein OAU50_08590 [Planctomycetota bacterium]|nr:hypothetical protein [Planctomycetota bacterium]